MTGLPFALSRRHRLGLVLQVREPDDRGGLQREALSTFMGHTSTHITMDRYGHLMLGSEEEAAGLLDAYLVRSAAR